MARVVGPSESQIHGAVIAYLRLAARPGVAFHHSPNEGRRTRWEGAQLARTGTQAGWPDLEIVAGGRAYFLEIKSERGRPTPQQAMCHDALREAGSEVAIVRSVDEAIATLRRWNVVREDRTATARAHNVVERVA